MTETTQDLLTEFNACAAYTQSDEITLIFPSVNVELKQTPLYGGRIQKIASLTAGTPMPLHVIVIFETMMVWPWFIGFATARFNLHLASREFGDTDKERELRVINNTHRCMWSLLMIRNDIMNRRKQQVHAHILIVAYLTVLITKQLWWYNSLIHSSIDCDILSLYDIMMDE